MTIGIMKLKSELELVPDFNASSVRILQTLRKGLGQNEIARELIAFDRLVKDFQVVVRIKLMLVADNCPCVLVRIAEGFGVVGVEGEIVSFDKLRGNLSNAETFKEGY